MSADANRATVERYWEAVAREDFDAAAKEFHDDFIELWPQSGERISGRENWLSMVRAYPGFPSIEQKRTIGRADLWVTEAAFDYARDGSPPWQVCAVQECRDGKIARITEFFGSPFEPADWRAEWVERG